MNRLPPDTFVTFCTDMDVSTLSGFFAEVGRPPAATGESPDWVWAVHDAYPTVGERSAWERARDLTRSRPGKSVFLASTPACELPARAEPPGPALRRAPVPVPPQPGRVRGHAVQPRPPP